MTRFVYRTIAIYRHTRRLLCIALSPKSRSLFSQTPFVKCCESMERQVNVDPSDALQRIKQDGDIITGDFEQKSVRSHPHAELKVFATLIEEALRGEQPYWAIGASKLMCAGCYAVIARAFPFVLSDHNSCMLVCKFTSSSSFLDAGLLDTIYCPR